MSWLAWLLLGAGCYLFVGVILALADFGGDFLDRPIYTWKHPVRGALCRIFLWPYTLFASWYNERLERKSENWGEDLVRSWREHHTKDRPNEKKD